MQQYMKIIYRKPKWGLRRKATLADLTEITQCNSLHAQHSGGRTAESGAGQLQRTAPHSREPDSDASAVVGRTAENQGSGTTHGGRSPTFPDTNSVLRTKEASCV